MQSACVVLYCHLWPAPRYNIFPHYLINGKILGGGGEDVSNMKCVFRFSLQLLSEILLETFAKLRRATISFVMSVRMEKVGFHWTDLMKSDI